MKLVRRSARVVCAYTAGALLLAGAALAWAGFQMAGWIEDEGDGQ